MKTTEATQRLAQAKSELGNLLDTVGDFSERRLSFSGTDAYELVWLAFMHFRSREEQIRAHAVATSLFPNPFAMPAICLANEEKQLNILSNKKSALINQLVEKLDKIIAETLQDIKGIDKDLVKIARAAADEYLAKRTALEREIRELEDYILHCKIKTVMSRIKPVLNGLAITWFTDRWSIPQKSGVYIICSDDEILYIGESEKIRQRLAPSHHVYEAEKHLVGVILTEDRKQLEALLIKTLHPTLNVKGAVSEHQISLLNDT